MADSSWWRRYGDRPPAPRAGRTLGKRKGQNPSVACVFRARAENAKRDAYPQAAETAQADSAALQTRELPDAVRRRWSPLADRTASADTADSIPPESRYGRQI
ncbi:hypothetical protein GCM10010234_17660 [Streptomyces hawaiiensis]